ncbi:extensin-like [Helianthus annuus]|uniref:extensin-like n=1 Tax=Helianthus annuus TaxID=4232 RepID=UPI001652DD85|nr:extensin-like [Helianthus annuus]
MSHKDVQVDKSLRFIEKPIAIEDRQVKNLRRKKLTIMPPRLRGRGKGPMRGGPSTAGPSHKRTPSASFSTSDSCDMWGQPFEPINLTIRMNLTHRHSLQSHSFHHSESPYSPRQFNPADYVNDFLGYNPLGPEDHFSQEMEMDDDPDPEMQTGTPGHPISISSGSPFQGSPYRGPDSFQEKMATYDWFFTPSYHSSPAQPPLDDPQLQAVSPPPLPVEEPPQQPPQPPPEPPRRRRNARMSVRGGPQDPQMGGPSNTAPEDNPPQASYAPPMPPVGFDNPIPTYPGSSGYNPYGDPSGYPLGYGTHDPYLTAAQYHHLYPSTYPPMPPTDYPIQGYQYPPYQPLPSQQLQQQQTQEILERLIRLSMKLRRTRRGILAS